jgi:hypothetical protein
VTLVSPTTKEVTMPKNEGPIDQLLEAIEAGTVEACPAFASDVILDATVPNWRFTVTGSDAVTTELSRWYATAGTFEELSRTPLPEGELVTFTLRWEEDGVPHAVHQAHLLTVAAERITTDQVWCGGRWPAGLLAEMAAAGS